MLKLNIEAMPLVALLQYHAYLVGLRFDPMTPAEHADYLDERSRVAMRIAFPRDT
jgi:hypothetical protein